MSVMQKLRHANNIRRTEGLTALAIRTLQEFGTARQKTSVHRKKKIHMLVRTEDVLRADWSNLPNHITKPKALKKGSYKTAWLMSRPGESSGGHQNIFRFIDYLERSGHDAKIYLYDNSLTPENISSLKKMLRTSPSYPNVSAEIVHYDAGKGVDSDTDAIFATGWETAYPVFNDASTARRLYFVQDFEPYFNAVGSESILAENTYKFGFFGITAGGWLAHKLKEDYGMQTDFFNFGADKDTYSITNTNERKEVFFYARPVTARRGFELGIMALDIFAKKKPEYKITLAGWDVSDYDIPFEYTNLSNVSIDQLNAVYNRCATGLVMSLTNMSLMPLELLSSGVIPVVNDGANNRMVSDNAYIEYCDPSPVAMAEAMVQVVERADLPQHAKKAAESVRSADWDASGARFVKIFTEVMRG